jgi:long-chain fatty acid transport protein
MPRKTVVLFLILFILSASRYLRASEFRPFDLSARAAALGGAFVTQTDDASAVYYNPAGLAFSSGLRLETNIFYPKMTSTVESSAFPSPFESTQGKIRLSPFFSLNIKDRFGFGIGAFAPNTMGTDWPGNWTGRALSINSKFNTLYIRPVAAIKISKFLSVGVGIDFISSDVAWKYERFFSFQEQGSEDLLAANSETNVSAKGLGYVAGILIRVSDNLRVGGRYQPKVKLDLEGFNFFLFPQMGSFVINQQVTSSLTLPQELVLGIMYSLGKSLTLQLDYQRIGMSEIKQWEFIFDPLFYEEFEDYFGTRPDRIRQGVDLNLLDTSRIMIGVEYRLKDAIIARAGYAHQKSAVDGQMIHPVFPDLETNTLSFGLGYDGSAYSIWDPEERTGGFTLDAYIQYGFSPNSPSALPELPATYKASRWTVGVGVGFSFG